MRSKSITRYPKNNVELGMGWEREVWGITRNWRRGCSAQSGRRREFGADVTTSKLNQKSCFFTA